MPKSIKTPQVGSIVWYYANPAPAPPQAAIVTLTVDQSHFNLFVLSGSAVGSAVLNVPYSEGGGVFQAVTAAAVAAGGAGYAVNDQISLSNGVVLRVLTLAATAIATVAILNAGSSMAASPPANPVAQGSTTGAGTGATFNLTWSSGAWCTYQRIFESTASVLPGMVDVAVAPTPMAATSGEHGMMASGGNPGHNPGHDLGDDPDDDFDDGDDGTEGPSDHTTARSVPRRAPPARRPTHR